jgi:hypothetical protein
VIASAADHAAVEACEVALHAWQMRALAIPLIAAVAACSAPPRSRMYPAGTDRDDGYGDLAQLSARLYIGNGSDAPFAAHRSRRPRAEIDAYGGDAYGGASYGSDASDSSAAGPTSPGGSPIFNTLQGAGAASPAPPRYTPTAGLTGAIEGTVRWRGAPPPPVTTPCGTIDNPSVRVAANRAVAGVLVYIERVEVGRTLPRPATVGGIVAKRGCAFAPALQILTPLPADLAIHGDTRDARIRVVFPTGTTRQFELQPAGRIVVAAPPGVTRIEADDSSLGAAWVVAATTPYYAITDELGRFHLDELATGSYEVTFWQPPLATSAGGKLVYGAPVVVHRTVKVDPAHPARVDLVLPGG